MDQNPIEERETNQSALFAFSVLFLILAAVSLINLIVPLVNGELSVAYMMQLTGSAENIVRIVLIVTIALAVLSILALTYMGIMGLRQSKGLHTGSAHIVIATIILVFLVIALILEAISFFTSPVKDWIGFFTSLSSVVVTVIYIRAAKALKQ